MNRNTLSFGLGLALLALLCGPVRGAAGQICEAEWLAGDGIPGVDGSVFATVVWDPDGDGPLPELLIIGGSFTVAGGIAANNIAAWDGENWSPLGAGVSEGDVWTGTRVNALTVFDDGTGPALYAAGDFTQAGGNPANYIARWDGSTWSPLGTEISFTVQALTVFDDGSGPALYAGGGFLVAGGGSRDNCCIAKWDGAAWVPLGAGVDNWVYAMTVFNDGTGPALYASGEFTEAGGSPANGIAKWDGAAWSSLGAGSVGAFALAVFDDGTGPALYAGAFARWDGVEWSQLGSGMNGSVRALTVFDDGSGPALYAGGYFTQAGGNPASRIARWDGAVWSPLGAGVSGLNTSVRALTVFDDGSGPALYAGGRFTQAGGSLASRIARWDSTDWSPLGGSGEIFEIWALTVFNDGSGPALYAGGAFTQAGGSPASRIARWDGTAWSPLGAGVNGIVRALTVFDDGSGPALYAGGDFTQAGGSPANYIARWDGAAWSPLGAGMSGSFNPRVEALTVFDDGNGPALYAGGIFTQAGGSPANSIARWDGAAWSPLGSGMNGFVHSMAVFDDGSGPALYAGGFFTTAGGQTANSIARWDGSAWSPLGAGVDDGVHALTVFNDGNGQALYAGGSFTQAGGSQANRIARWDGVAWSSLGAGMTLKPEVKFFIVPSIFALTVFNDGSGSALYAGGEFTLAGGSPANYIARWNGTAWSSLGGGVNSKVEALAVFDPDGASGPAPPRLIAGGGHTQFTSDALSGFLAQYGEDSNIWSSPSGGQFEDPSRWLCDRALSAFDEFIIDATLAGYSPSAFGLNFNPDNPGLKLARTFRVRTDDVIINLSGSNFELTEGTKSIARPGLVVGELPDLAGRLTISNTSPLVSGLSVGAVSIADQPTTGPTKINRLLVRNPTTFLDVAGDAYVGRRGDRGELFVRSQAIAHVEGIISVGTDPGAVGEIRVFNPGTEFWHSQPFPSGAGRSMAIGQSGAGTFRIGGTQATVPPQAGAQAASLGRLDTLTLGTNTTGVGLVSIEGPGSQWVLNSTRLLVGLSGSGTINITNGGLLDTSTLNELTIGVNPSSTGLVSVTGNGSRWVEVIAPITVGPTGTLHVGAGAIVESPVLIVLPGGTVSGDGQIGDFDVAQSGGLLADVINLGAFTPGDGAGTGTLTIVGDYRQVGPPPGGSVDLAGTLRARVGSSGQSSRLNVLGTAELGGGLFIELDEGYIPQPGDAFEVFTAGAFESNASRFDVAFMPGLTDGRYMRLQYGEVANAQGGPEQGVVQGVEQGVDMGFAQGAIVSVDLLANLLGFGDPDAVPVNGTPTAVAVGDLNENGADDIAVTLLGSGPGDPGSLLVLYNNGDGTTFTAQQFPVGPQPSGIALGDLRNIGVLDIAVTSAGDNSVRVLSNTGASFTPAATITVGNAPADVVAGAFATPGVVDLLVANAADGTVQRLSNNGLGVFMPQSPIAVGLQPVALAVGDVNNSGQVDAAVALNGENAVRLLTNIGGGTLLPQPKLPVGAAPIGIAIEDLEYDKDLDQRPSLIVINSVSNDLSILRGDGNGLFAPAVNLPLGGAPRSLAAWDMDGDGATDLAIVVDDAELGPLVRILRNDTEFNSGQLVFAPADDVGVGEGPALVTSGDLTGDDSDELITLNTPSSSMAMGMPGANGDAPGTDGMPLAELRFRPALGTTKPTPCVGDLNGDGVVDADDLGILLAAFGSSSAGDLNGDGVTDADDLGILLAAFGNTCK